MTTGGVKAKDLAALVDAGKVTTSGALTFRPSAGGIPWLARAVVRAIWQVPLVTLSMVTAIAAVSVGGISFQLDFNGDLYNAGLKILHGVSPYQPAKLAHEAALILSGGAFSGAAFPRWPAPALLLAVPFDALPVHAADILFFLLSLGAFLVALRIMEVRDPRCIAVALISCPTVTGLLLGNISPLVMLGAAIVWRYRERLVAPAIATTAVVVGKLFLWPLGIWMLMTRRWKMFGISLVAGLVSVVAAWALIGFDGLLQYPQILLNVAIIGERRGCSLTGFLMYLGVPMQMARGLALASAIGLLYMAARLVRRPELEGNAFGLVIIAALCATPVVWAHYMVLLYIPIAILSPRLSYLWFLPMLAMFAATPVMSGTGLAALPLLLGELALMINLSRPLLGWVSVPQLRRSRVATASAAAPS